MKPDFTRACKSDEPSLGMAHKKIAYFAAAAREEVYYTGGKRNRFEQFHELRRDDRAFARRFEHNGISGRYRGHRHPDHNGEREVPWRHYQTHPERNIEHLVQLVWK